MGSRANLLSDCASFGLDRTQAEAFIDQAEPGIEVGIAQALIETPLGLVTTLAYLDGMRAAAC